MTNINSLGSSGLASAPPPHHENDNVVLGTEFVYRDGGFVEEKVEYKGGKRIIISTNPVSRWNTNTPIESFTPRPPVFGSPINIARDATKIFGYAAAYITTEKKQAAFDFALGAGIGVAGHFLKVAAVASGIGIPAVLGAAMIVGACKAGLKLHRNGWHNGNLKKCAGELLATTALCTAGSLFGLFAIPGSEFILDKVQNILPPINLGGVIAPVAGFFQNLPVFKLPWAKISAPPLMAASVVAPMQRDIAPPVIPEPITPPKNIVVEPAPAPVVKPIPEPVWDAEADRRIVAELNNRELERLKSLAPQPTSIPLPTPSITPGMTAEFRFNPVSSDGTLTGRMTGEAAERLEVGDTVIIPVAVLNVLRP